VLNVEIQKPQMPAASIVSMLFRAEGRVRIAG
jgi:hypothetical protein